MIPLNRFALALLALLVLAVPLRAQAPDAGDAKVTHNRDVIVSTDWLAARLDSGVVVVHVGRSDSTFRAAHVPGARFLPIATVAATVNGIPNEFPAVAQLTASFRALGIGASARVVIYGDDPGIFAARTWTALDLLGHGERAIPSANLAPRTTSSLVRIATPRACRVWRTPTCTPVSLTKLASHPAR